MFFSLVRTRYAQLRLDDKLEYIRRCFKNRQAYINLIDTISDVESKLCSNPFLNCPHVDLNDNEYRYAKVNVGDGYYIMYVIEGSTIIVIDYLHKRELRE